MKIGIIGIGAMGSLFAARLHGLADVMMLGHWAAQITAVRQHGLTLIHPDGHQTHHPIPITSNPTDIHNANFVFVLVKSHQTEQAAQLALQILAPDGLAVTLQNGLGNWEKLTTVLGKERVTLGVTTEGATIVAPGTVRHAGHGVTHLATRPEIATRVTTLAQLLTHAGFETHLSENVDGLVWGKLAINAGINPITAVLRVPNGHLAQNPHARTLMQAAAREVAQIASALGITLPYPDAGQRTLEVAQATAANHSSMLQDILRGATTEIDAICGEVVRHGQHLGIPTPVNRCLLELVRAIPTPDS
ncbi:MAG: 2-dehydropantoate 2-reductase [Chloroflexi bacterium]|nr:MAG: 2-dehydropantoate 2-reductase [Chloroflexota bacterium]